MIFGKSKKIRELQFENNYLRNLLKEKNAKEIAHRNLEVGVKKLTVKRPVGRPRKDGNTSTKR
jgi:hypothetical protein